MKGIRCNRVMADEKGYGVTDSWQMKGIWCNRVMADERDMVKQSFGG